jgi:hypothetical protein
LKADVKVLFFVGIMEATEQKEHDPDPYENVIGSGTLMCRIGVDSFLSCL